MVCVGLSERDLENFGRPLGGPGKILGGSATPWHPPSSAPVIEAVGIYPSVSDCIQISMDLLYVTQIRSCPKLNKVV